MYRCGLRAERATSLSSYFWQSPISPSPTRSKEVISFVSLPFSQYLPFFLAFLEHLSPYYQSTFITGFKITVFVRQENISDLYRGNFRHEEMKLCGKSAAAPEKGPNAALINTYRLIARHSSLEHSVAQCLLLKSFTHFHFWKQCSQFSYAPSPRTTRSSSAPVMLFKVTQMAQLSTLKEQIKSLHD